mmetsp:Transcript_10661/g.16176  ORF Transcript_10661/g.16176 Transcript_10661/m.16176 type:complete len:475 (-) Transcript_10661:206-1630(-)
MTSSNAAVASLSAPANVLKSDGLINLIVHLLPSNQVKVSVPKKGQSITLSIGESTSTTAIHQLSERNAILRTLCGLSLLNQLDKYPFVLMGGYSEAMKASDEASMVIASIGSFMSVASLIRSGESGQDILSQLDEVLADNSFLVGSTGKPTLADYDVLYAMHEKKLLSGDDVSKKVKNVCRWAIAVVASIEEMRDLKTNSTSVTSKAPELDIPALDFAIADPVPAFFFGDEGDVAVEASKTSKSTAKGREAPQGKPSGGSGAGGLSEEERKAAAEKRAKKNAEKAKKKASNKESTGVKQKHSAPAATELDVTALDIRVGKIVEAWEHESSDKLWCEKIDIGEKEPRQVLSGLRNFYKKEEMQDRIVMVLCNLKKRNLAGVPSHGMVLCASNADHTAVEFVVPPEGAKIGERVEFEGLKGEPEGENKLAKKKMLEKIAPDLKTNDEGVVVWKNNKSITSAGPCLASKGMKGAQVS